MPSMSKHFETMNVIVLQCHFRDSSIFTIPQNSFNLTHTFLPLATSTLARPLNSSKEEDKAAKRELDESQTFDVAKCIRGKSSKFKPYLSNSYQILYYSCILKQMYDE